MKSSILKTACILMTMSLAPTVLHAADPAPGDTNVKNGGKTTSASSAEAARLNLAHQLARYGLSKKDPVALVAAARMMNEAGGKPLAAEAKKSAATDPASAPKATPLVTDSKEALDAARKLAHGDKTLLALIEDAGKNAHRGALGGPNFHRDHVLAGKTDVYEVNFEGDEPAEVHLSGDGDATLWLTVYDQGGHQICRDDDNAQYSASCRWTPAWTGPFRIEINNTGDIYVNYALVVN